MTTPLAPATGRTRTGRIVTDVTAQPPSDAPSHLRGAVDLSSLGTPAPAGRTAPGADAGAGGGSWVIADADQGLLQQLV